MARIYTRSGDGGETSLGDGSRVSKSGARVDLYGDVDELNSVLGVAAAALGADPAVWIESCKRAPLLKNGVILLAPPSLIGVATWRIRLLI